MTLCLERVSAGYGTHMVLRDVSVHLRGPRTALLGANGSGKTTLLRVLSGAHVPSAGRVLFDADPVRHDRAGLRRHRQRAQLLLQDPDDQLFSADVLRDVSFGPLNLGLSDDEVRGRVDDALAVLSITHLADRPTHQLSYGERKRVALAGAVAMRPSVLLLDEPSAGLDPEGVAEVLMVLERLVAAGTTLVAATHNVELALKWADEIVVLTPEGVRHGDPLEVLDDTDLLARARLSRPWPLELAARLGLPRDDRPKSLDEVVRLLGARQPVPDGQTH